jgi:hypothetical protein
MCGEQIKCDAYDTRTMIIKVGETYVMSTKTGQSNLENRNIRFCQKNHQN